MENPSDTQIRRLLATAKTIAMVGASPNPSRPSHQVMAYLLGKGYRVIPVSPRVADKSLLGQQGYATLADIPEPFDMVDIFRDAESAGQVVDQAIELLPVKPVKAIWMQLGVINTPAAQRASAAGLAVVMYRCPKIEIERLAITLDPA